MNDALLFFSLRPALHGGVGAKGAKGGSFLPDLCVNVGPAGPESAFLQLFHCQAILPAAQMPVNLLSSFCPLLSDLSSPSLRGLAEEGDTAILAIRAVSQAPPGWTGIRHIALKCVVMLRSVLLYLQGLLGAFKTLLGCFTSIK